jgi:hypothetical protein
MEFRGSYLQCVLAKQTQPLSVFDDVGRSYEVKPREAFVLSLSKKYVGIGHQKRIRYIRPEHVRICWRGNSRNQMQRIRNDQGEIIAPDYHLEFKPLVQHTLTK